MPIQVIYYMGELYKASEKAFDCLPCSEYARIIAINNKIKRNASLCAYLLLKYAVFKEKNISCPEILRTSKGKPYIKGNPFFFSLSHTNNAVICAISNSSVGVDLENPRVFNEHVARKICSQPEIKFLEKMNTPAKKSNAFCKMWVQKEAYSKMTGNGFSEGFKKIDTINSDRLTHAINKNDTGEFIGYSSKTSEINLFINEVSYEAVLRNNPNFYNAK